MSPKNRRDLRRLALPHQRACLQDGRHTRSRSTPMQINLNYDSSVTWSNFNSNPNVGLLEEAAFKQAVQYAATIFDKLFTNNVTVTIDVGWGEIQGSPIAANGPSAVSRRVYETYSYQKVSQALINNAQSAIQ
jgi:hypothetical protein